MNHNISRALFAAVVGLFVAWLSYQWITDPSGRSERQLQISVVEAARGHVRDRLALETIEIVDPVATNRKAGKVYVYREDDGWAVSGFYRRGEPDRWHPFLLSMSAELSLRSLKVQDADAELLERAATDPLLEVSP